MQQPTQIKRTVLLWVAVTMALWATLPMAMYLSHWQWFGWMPRSMHAPPGAFPHHPHSGPPGLVINMATLLLMSAVFMAVVLWLVSMRRRDS